MAKLQPGDVAKRCLCINGVPGDVQINEICVNFTGLFDVHVAKNGKHVFLFKDEQAALLQLQQTPKITLKHGRAPNNNICLTVNRCDVDDINTSWLIPNQSKVEQGTSYFNEAAAEEPLYQNPAQFLSFNNEQTYEWNWGNNPNQHQQMHEWNRGNNPNQHQQPTDTSAIHPPPGMGSYGPGWGQYPHPNQYYPGFQHPPGSGQNFYQDGNQQIPSMPNPSHFAHGPWYGPGFPPYGPQGMGYPSTGGMHEGRDQQVPPAIYQWGSMTQPHGVQMPHTNEPGPGSGHLPQYSQHLQHGPPPPFESSKDGSSVTKVKSSVSDTTSDDHNKETKLQPYMATKSPSQKEAVSPEDVATVDRDEFPEIKKKKQEGQGGTAVKNNEQDEPVIKMKVTKLPEDTTEDTLMNYFENRRRSGGGTIKSIEYHPATSSAIIEFEEVEAIDRVLNKAPLLFLKKQISVEEYVEEVEDTEEEEEEPSCRTIEVRGFAENTSEEVLEMYFENTKRSGGGEVTSVVIEGGVALVTFLDKDVVSSVLQREHTVDGQSLTVTLHLPKKKPSAMEVEEEEDEPHCTIEVRGYKTMSEDTLQMYFENTKRSGGDEIIKFELIETDRIIFITFASEEVAKNVAEREHVVGGCNLKVKLYVPPKRKSARNLSRTTSNEPEESVPHCTIEVKGVSQKICGTLQLYFENTKRSGGDEIVKFEHKETDEIAYITFGSEDVAKRVVSHGQHKVEGQLLEVKLYIPPPPRPIYDDRVLLTGFTSKVTQDGLTNFLEAKTGLTPVKYVYGEDEGKVIITFQETIDFEKLEEACKKRPLEGSYLVPSKVYVSNSIIISNLKTTTTEDTIELYFENEKRSYGGPVEKVEFKREEEYCLVFFEDHTICDRVLQRKHKIDGSELQVSIYYESLGRISEDDNGPSFKPPKPLKLEMLEFAKMQFLMRSEPNRTALEKQLQDCFTQIQWPQTETDCTILTCTLTSHVQDCKKKALTWAKQAEQNLNDFLKVISVHNLEVFQDIFETVLQNLQNLTIANPDGVALFVKNAQFCIQVVGHKAVVTAVVKDIDDIIKKAVSDFDRKKKQTKETITNLKYYQLRLLLAQKYPSITEKQFNGLKVKINTNKNEIVFEGVMEDIRVAKIVMYEKIHNAAVTQLKNLSEGRLFLYKSKEVKDYIVAKLKSKKLAGVWDAEGTGLNIYANSDEAVVQSAHIINDSVKEHQRDLKSSQRSVLESQQWKDKMKNLEQQYHGKVYVVLAPDFSKLFLFFTDDILGIVCEEVDDFLSKNTIFEQLVACNSGMIKLIEKKDSNEVDKIAKDLAHCYVQITIQSKGGFLVRGNQEGINQATSRLQQLVQKINHRDHELIKPGIAQYMESKGREHIFAVENQIPCVIQLKEQEQYGSGKNEEEPERFGMVGTRGSSPAIQAECKSYGLEKIFSALGDITEIDVDVLVNAADPKLEHRGGVAKAMVDKGGRDIREECMQHVRKNGHLAEGEIHVTSAGHLRAKIIIHAVSPVWKGGHNNEEEVLRETIFKCMETAAKNKLKSIAIPALGSGVFGWPPDKSTKVIAEAVKDFFREDQESSIMEVYLSDINPETVRYFTEALEKSFGKQRVTEVKQRPTPTPRNIKGFTLPGAVAVMPRMPVDVLSSQPSNFGRILVKVVKGEMASEKVEVIVNTTSKSLDLTNGAVSQSLLTKGGQTLQDECKKKYPNGIKDGDIAVTGGGHLSCKIVCHLALAKWTDETKSKKMLNVLMKKCLDQCEKNGYTSIAFPALGTGNLGFPKDIVAKEMFKHISTYSRDNPSSSVTDVRFVVYQKDIPTVQAFESAQQEWSSSGTGLGTLTRQNIQSSQYEEAMDTDDSSGFADGFTFGKINVKIYQGDITQENSDCIVNSSNEDLDLSRGAVSVAIMKKGRKQLEDECKAKVSLLNTRLEINHEKQVGHISLACKLADDMKKNGIAVTKGYGLNCKHLIHVVAVESNKWAPIINKCLLKAEELKARSIAFPALGTGVGVPPAEIASVMYKAITDFQASGAKSVTEVRIVIFQDQMVQAFVDAARNYGSGAKPRTPKYFGGSNKQAPRKVQIDLTSTVWIDVYAWEKRTLDAAISKLDNLIKNDFSKADFSESIVKTFSHTQVSALQRHADQSRVQLTIDPKIGRITIEGIADGIMTVSNGIHRLIREADKKEQEKKSAELLKKLVQWYFIVITTECSELKEYPADVNFLIETAYKDNKPFVTFFTDDGEECKIDFSKMEECSVQDPSEALTVVRKDLIQEMALSELPATWAKMAPNENLKVVNLQSTDKEYQDVQQKFLQSVGGNKTISKLERIQNRTLYQQYEAKKKLIEQNNRGHPNESSLWHGTSVDSVDSISMHGFNRSYCGKNATAYGDGVYFAKNASYSANDTYSKPDSSGNKKMYLCRVLTGQYTTGKQGMRVAPAKSSSNPNDLYDSVVNNINNPEIFVIFNDTQAIPEYLITFK